MIASLLVANRGEIACRVIRTAGRLGIRTVAVYSDSDAKALHVRMADEAVHIGPSTARESYLRGDKIIEAAKQTNAAAIHPGYGFLSENADFAEAVIAAGLIWVGPKPDSIRAMGLKDAAKKLMAAAGVPVTPGYLGENQDSKHLKTEADAIGYPVLIKAVAGGGGKGMRRVDEPGQFADALDSARREAASAFGDERVLIEKYILSPRHIEVQVFGDGQGNVVHLFERDCSLQRRHQKVIEEAPAPGMDSKTREAVCGAAVKAALAVNYENAGTIEFIADASEGLRAERIWFMEMNTRLQVEHPVTEEITGQDLVEWQLRVASGEPLPTKQDELSIRGHAIEARLYAEDPSKGFLPSTGRLEIFDLSDHLRVETGVYQGQSISPHYDPMIAKMIVHAQSREQAISTLARGLACSSIWPVKTNLAFLVRLLHDPDVRSGNVDTGLIDRRAEQLLHDPKATSRELTSAACLLNRELGRSWLSDGLFGFRLNAPSLESLTLAVDGIRTEFVPDAGPIEGSFLATGDPATRIWSNNGALASVSVYEPRGEGASHGRRDGHIEAPMPGKITAVDVSNGESVAKGQRLLTLEAMKMEHSLVAPFGGVISDLSAIPGAQVTEGQLLAKVEAEPQT